MKSDREYVEKLSDITNRLGTLDLSNYDDSIERDKLLDEVSSLNTDWKNRRRWHRRQWIVKLIILFLVLFFVILTIVC